MKSRLYLICSLLVLFTSIYSCEKEPNGNGSLVVKVQSYNQTIPLAKVYLKKGIFAHPKFTDDQYDGILTADGDGVVVFSNLTPGQYYLKASRSSGKVFLQGDTTARVLRRFRGDNLSNFTIDIK